MGIQAANEEALKAVISTTNGATARGKPAYDFQLARLRQSQIWTGRVLL